MWVGHHRRFRVIVAHDTGLIVINLALLFVVASVPFPTSLLGEFAPERTAVVVYAACMTAIPLVGAAQWWYVRRRGLLSPEVDDVLLRYVGWGFLPMAAVFGASIPVALLVGGDEAMFLWYALLVVGPVQGVLTARHYDRRAAASAR